MIVVVQTGIHSRRRRWFRYGLRTMFVLVTVFSVWLGWYVTLARQRETARDWIVAKGGFFSDSTCAPADIQATKEVQYARILQLLGDQRTRYINLVRCDVTWQERERIARLFPEAWVVPERQSGFRHRPKPRELVRTPKFP